MGSGGSARPAVLQYCQHSSGLGHLVRSLAVAAGLAERFRVVVMSGGAFPAGLSVPSGVELVALPAIESTDDGRTLESAAGHLDLEQVWGLRLRMLLDALEMIRPAAVVVEQFPLGRRKFARELVPFLRAARSRSPRPVVVCSVRDILVRRGVGQARRDDEAAELLNTHFDAVVVHGDPRLARLEETFRPATPVLTPVHYSGLVVPGPADPPDPSDPSGPSDQRGPIFPARPARASGRASGAPLVVVSSGGGRAGGALLRAAGEAQRLVLASRGVEMLLFTGPFFPEPDGAALAAAGGAPGLRVERFTRDLCSTMACAAVSVSLCGYNTALDIIRARVPALVVPHDTGHETEQADRASRLAALGAVRVLGSHELSPPRLAREVLGLIGTIPPALGLDLEGAGRSAELVAELVAARSGGIATAREEVATPPVG